jgi:hypothetical protein
MSETGHYQQYDPRPIDTSGIIIPNSLIELSEKLAANVHDVWASGRIRAGWQYGPYRDDAAKTNPCLIAYDQLPPSEQELDMNMVTETIRSIIALGYEIVPTARSSADGETTLSE